MAGPSSCSSSRAGPFPQDASPRPAVTPLSRAQGAAPTWGEPGCDLHLYRVQIWPQTSSLLGSASPRGMLTASVCSKPATSSWLSLVPCALCTCVLHPRRRVGAKDSQLCIQSPMPLRSGRAEDAHFGFFCSSGLCSSPARGAQCSPCGSPHPAPSAPCTQPCRQSRPSAPRRRVLLS